jgi:hypothetical protein
MRGAVGAMRYAAGVMEAIAALASVRSDSRGQVARYGRVSTLRVNSRATIELPTCVGGMVPLGVIGAALIVVSTRRHCFAARITPSAQADSSVVARHFSAFMWSQFPLQRR